MAHRPLDNTFDINFRPFRYAWQFEDEEIQRKLDVLSEERKFGCSIDPAEK